MQFPIEKLRGIQTPFYYYDMELLQRTLDTVSGILDSHPSWHMHYAVKANADKRVLSRISRAGFGADCVSGWEIEAALEAGFPASGIVFAGVGKTDREIEFALKSGIGSFNVESEAELAVLAETASAMGVKAAVCLRVNPDVGAHTHSNIVTGLAENKFGINIEQLDSVLEKALACESVDFKGLHFHIGSQITDMQDFVALCNRINELIDRYSSKGVFFQTINVGGGLGIDYHHPDEAPIPPFARYFDVFSSHLDNSRFGELHFELGRSIVAQCASLIASVIYVKKGTCRQFAILDAGMNDLIRPALYHAFHKIQNITSDAPEQDYDVVGPVCESSDVFAKSISLPACSRGDLIAIRSAGAYGQAMSMTYNCRPLAKSYYSDK